MKLPAIIKYTMHNHIVLCFENGHAYHLDGEFKGEWSDDYYIDHTARNNTAEYLANTYGEVKSKEHAEFIVKLAEVNGIDFDGEVGISSNYFCFFPSNSKQLTFWRKEKDASKHGSRKQITIPLPPECEGVDEWPVVGDKVQTSDGVGTVKLLPDSKGYYVISIKDEYYQYQFDELSKPKTPEQELHDDIAEQLEFITDNTLSADSCCIQIIVDAMLENSISGLEIKKSRNSG